MTTGKSTSTEIPARLRTAALKTGLFLSVVALITGSAYLVVNANQSYRLVEITLQPQIVLSGVTIFRTAALIVLTPDGVARMDLAGSIRDPSLATRLLLKIRPAQEPSVWHKQACCLVTDGSFFGVIELGSVQWPLTNANDYGFALSSEESGIVLANGSITSRERPTVTSGRWQTLAAGFVGIVSAVIQIGQMFVMFAQRRKGAAYGHTSPPP
jgi:hypothetical protein